MPHSEYDPPPAPTGHDWAEQASAADDRYDRDRQAEIDNRLTDDERDLAVGCLSTFVQQMGADLRRGDLTPEGQAKYRRDIRTANAAVAKLLGVWS